MQLPNKPESAALVRGDLSAVLTELYGEDRGVCVPVKQDARYPLTVSARADVETSIDKCCFGERDEVADCRQACNQECSSPISAKIFVGAGLGPAPTT